MKLRETLKDDGKVQVDEKKDDVNEVGGNNNEEKRICLPRATSGVSVRTRIFQKRCSSYFNEKQSSNELKNGINSRNP